MRSVLPEFVVFEFALFPPLIPPNESDVFGFPFLVVGFRRVIGALLFIPYVATPNKSVESNGRGVLILVFSW